MLSGYCKNHHVSCLKTAEIRHSRVLHGIIEMQELLHDRIKNLAFQKTIPCIKKIATANSACRILISLLD